MGGGDMLAAGVHGRCEWGEVHVGGRGVLEVQVTDLHGGRLVCRCGGRGSAYVCEGGGGGAGMRVGTSLLGIRCAGA